MKKTLKIYALAIKTGRNLHCSISDGNIFAGANLPKDNLLFMNYISSEKATEQLLDFINDTDSLIFGCAGIQSLVNKSFYTGKGTLAGFMFGEIVTMRRTNRIRQPDVNKIKSAVIFL